MGAGLTNQMKDMILQATRPQLKAEAVPNAQGQYDLDDYELPIYDPNDEFEK